MLLLTTVSQLFGAVLQLCLMTFIKNYTNPLNGYIGHHLACQMTCIFTIVIGPNHQWFSLQWGLRNPLIQPENHVPHHHQVTLIKLNRYIFKMEPPRHIPPSKHAPSSKHALPSDHAQSSDHASLNNNDPNTVPMPSTVPPVELPLHRPQVTQQNTQQHALHPSNTASHSSPPTSMLTRMTEVPSAVALPYANLCPMACRAALQRYQMENGISGIVYMVETTLPAQSPHNS